MNTIEILKAARDALKECIGANEYDRYVEVKASTSFDQITAEIARLESEELVEKVRSALVAEWMTNLASNDETEARAAIKAVLGGGA